MMKVVHNMLRNLQEIFSARLLVFTITIALLRNCFVIADGTCQSFCNAPSAWIEQEEHICVGTKRNTNATFHIKRDCRLFAIRLRHLSGILNCNADKKDYASRWGCRWVNCIFPDRTCFTTLFFHEGKIFFDNEREMTYDNLNHYYVKGFGLDDDVLIFRKTANLSVGDKFEIIDGEGFQEGNTLSNNGDEQHCFGIDVSCFE